jgi:hypothetical protein
MRITIVLQNAINKKIKIKLDKTKIEKSQELHYCSQVQDITVTTLFEMNGINKSTERRERHGHGHVQ